MAKNLADYFRFIYSLEPCLPDPAGYAAMRHQRACWLAGWPSMNSGGNGGRLARHAISGLPGRAGLQFHGLAMWIGALDPPKQNDFAAFSTRLDEA